MEGPELRQRVGPRLCTGAGGPAARGPEGGRSCGLPHPGRGQPRPAGRWAGAGKGTEQPVWEEVLSHSWADIRERREERAGHLHASLRSLWCEARSASACCAICARLAAPSAALTVPSPEHRASCGCLSTWGVSESPLRVTSWSLCPRPAHTQPSDWPAAPLPGDRPPAQAPLGNPLGIVPDHGGALICPRLRKRDPRFPAGTRPGLLGGLGAGRGGLGWRGRRASSVKAEERQADGRVASRQWRCQPGPRPAALTRLQARRLHQGRP